MIIDDARMNYYDKICKLGLLYANDDGQSYFTWTLFVCAILNKIYEKECFAEDSKSGYLPIKFNNEFILKIDDKKDVIKTLYEFLDNQILLFKLDIIK